jgi:hypothetical protein
MEGLSTPGRRRIFDSSRTFGRSASGQPDRRPCEFIEETLKALIEAKLVSTDAEEQDARVIYGSWQMPMYAVETKIADVALEDLHAAQKRELYAEM